MPIISNTFSVPAPTGGWNARDPVARMPDTDAIRMINMFPATGFIEARNGFREHSSGMGSGPVETVAEFNKQDGTRKLVACANNNIYDATTFTGTATNITGTTTPTLNQWQTVNFNNRLILVNGTDQPQQYDGTTVSDASYTGVSSDNLLINVSSYKSRLYFVEKNTASVWYGGVDAITGALTEFNVSGELQKGGTLLYAGSWTSDTGDGLTDFLVIASDRGELLTYTGNNPGDSSWTLSGRFHIPVPIGFRSFGQIGADLAIITEDGVYTLSQILGGLQAAGGEGSLSGKINTEFNNAATLYRENFGWQTLLYPKGRYALVNIPVVEDDISYQYVVNIQTGAWCEFRGQNASSWTLHKEKPYFGGMDGKVYEADVTGNDDSSNICVDVKWAFNYFGDPSSQKFFHLARPLIKSNSSTVLEFGIDVDYEDTVSQDTVTVITPTGTPWGSAWGSPWSQSTVFSSNWTTLSGIGRAAALKLVTELNGVDFELSAVDISYEPGGVI
jgi:hypothetical protein